MAYQVVTGSSAEALALAVATASMNGWLIVGGVATSGSNYVQAMTKETIVTIPYASYEQTQSLNSAFPAGARGLWSFGFPSGSGHLGIPGLD